jgi:hypothetical protein
MSEVLFPKKMTRRDCPFAGGIASASPAGSYQHRNNLYVPDLASRVTTLDADDQLATHLGDGKEADGKTNRPEYQTNPALFAAPHALTVDSKGDL